MNIEFDRKINKTLIIILPEINVQKEIFLIELFRQRQHRRFRYLSFRTSFYSNYFHSFFLHRYLWSYYCLICWGKSICLHKLKYFRFIGDGEVKNELSSHSCLKIDCVFCLFVDIHNVQKLSCLK